MTERIGIIGGGLAGIAAALRCADAGHQVLMLEARPSLGGLTNSFRRDALDVDNGQHVFLRCCTSYRSLLVRLGVENDVTLQNRLDVEVVDPHRAVTGRLRRNALPAPLHLAGSLLRYRPLSFADRLRAARGTLALRRLDLADAGLDEQAFGAWLVAHGQNDRTVAALWDLFGVATLNAHSAEASLALAAMVFQTGLFSEPKAGDIGWSLVPLQQLHGTAAIRALTASGAEIRTRAKVMALAADRDGWLITERDGDRHRVDKVVLAVPPAQAEALLPAASLDLAAGWASRLGSSPIVNAHVVFDRTVMTEPFLAGVATPAQWVFDRTRQSGLAAGQYIAVSISAADDYIDVETAHLRELVLAALGELLPRSRGARVLDFFVTRERFATFRPSPGTARCRPGPVTHHHGLVLAGAWTDTGWPATMEGAVRSGEAAAAALEIEIGAGQKGGLPA